MKIDNLRKKRLNLSGFINVNNIHEVEKGGVYIDSPLNRKLGRVGQPYKKSDKQEEKIPSKIPGSTDEITRMSVKGLHNAILGVNNIGTNISDKGDHFQINFDENDFKTHGEISPKITQIKRFLEGIGASVIIGKNSMKAYKNKKDNGEGRGNGLKGIIGASTTLKDAKGDRLNAIIDYAGFDISKDKSDSEKRYEIAKKYMESAELEGSTEEIANQLDEIVEDALSDENIEKKYPTPKKDPYFEKMDEIEKRESKFKDNKNISFPLKDGKVSEKELKDFLLDRYPNNKKEIDSFVDNQIIPYIKRYKDGNYPVIKDKMEFLTTFEYYNLNKNKSSKLAPPLKKEKERKEFNELENKNKTLFEKSNLAKSPFDIE